MSNDVLARNELFSFEESKPVASYIKTILGQVAVNVWDRFTNQPTIAILKGDPKRKDEGCIVDVWSTKEDAFFKRTNKRHFDRGVMIPFQRPVDVVKETPVEQFSDEQLKELVSAKFVTFNKKVNEIDSIPVLFRMLSIAEEAEKLKHAEHLKARISELQRAEYSTKEESPKEE